MPRYLLLSRPPKVGQALALAKATQSLRLDGVASPDAVLVAGEDIAVAVLLAAHPGRLSAERVVELLENPETPPLPSPRPIPTSSSEPFPPGPLEPLPRRFRASRERSPSPLPSPSPGIFPTSQREILDDAGPHRPGHRLPPACACRDLGRASCADGRRPPALPQRLSHPIRT